MTMQGGGCQQQQCQRRVPANALRLCSPATPRLRARCLCAGQWAGTVAVFGALYYKAFSKKDGGHKPKTSGIPEEPPKEGGEAETLPLVGDAAEKGVALPGEPPKV